MDVGGWLRILQRINVNKAENWLQNFVNHSSRPGGWWEESGLSDQFDQRGRGKQFFRKNVSLVLASCREGTSGLFDSPSLSQMASLTQRSARSRVQILKIGSEFRAVTINCP
jgi:hypothetical protein